MKKPETMWIAMNETTMREFPVGVGRGNPAVVLRTGDAIIVNDEDALTLIKSDGTRIVRRPGLSVEASNTGRRFVVNGVAPSDIVTRESDIGGNRMAYWVTLGSGGRCVFVQDRNGHIEHFSSRGVYVNIRAETIEVSEAASQPEAAL